VDERLSWPGWLTRSGWFTHKSGHPLAAGRALDMESSPARDRRSTTVPRNQPTPEITRVETVNFGTIRQNLAYYIAPNISRCAGPIFTNFSEFVDRLMGVTKLTFVLRSAKGRCYGNELIFGAVFRRQKIDHLHCFSGVSRGTAISPHKCTH